MHLWKFYVMFVFIRIIFIMLSKLCGLLIYYCHFIIPKVILCRIGLFFIYFNWTFLNFSLQISGRLFSDSGPRRSSRLAAESTAHSNSSTALISNGTSNSSKYLGASKLSSMALRSVTVRKGQPWANENSEEGDLFYVLVFVIYCAIFSFLMLRFVEMTDFHWLNY